jgi:hypothetical protein
MMNIEIIKLSAYIAVAIVALVLVLRWQHKLEKSKRTLEH